MPNHVTNIIKAPEHVIAALKGEKELVDFNTMIPMPKALESIEVNGDEAIVAFLFGELGTEFNEDGNDLRKVIGSMQLERVFRVAKAGSIVNWDDKRFENFINMLKCRRECGTTSWYEFGIDRWGTKWNAYEIVELEDGVQFETAWSAPLPVIEKLAEKFPDERIEHLWADEDIGSNLGHVIYENGESREVEIDDDVGFALAVTNNDRDWYRQNPDTGKWEYYEDEDESDLKE